MEVVKYSDKSYALFGDSRQIKDVLMQENCKYNRFLTYNGKKMPGWIISNNKVDTIKNYIDSMSNQENSDENDDERSNEHESSEKKKTYTMNDVICVGDDNENGFEYYKILDKKICVEITRKFIDQESCSAGYISKSILNYRVYIEGENDLFFLLSFPLCNNYMEIPGFYDNDDRKMEDYGIKKSDKTVLTKKFVKSDIFNSIREDDDDDYDYDLYLHGYLGVDEEYDIIYVKTIEIVKSEIINYLNTKNNILIRGEKTYSGIGVIMDKNKYEKVHLSIKRIINWHYDETDTNISFDNDIFEKDLESVNSDELILIHEKEILECGQGGMHVIGKRYSYKINNKTIIIEYIQNYENTPKICDNNLSNAILFASKKMREKKYKIQFEKKYEIFSELFDMNDGYDILDRGRDFVVKFIKATK